MMIGKMLMKTQNLSTRGITQSNKILERNRSIAYRFRVHNCGWKFEDMLKLHMMVHSSCNRQNAQHLPYYQEGDWLYPVIIDSEDSLKSQYRY